MRAVEINILRNSGASFTYILEVIVKQYSHSSLMCVFSSNLANVTYSKGESIELGNKKSISSACPWCWYCHMFSVVWMRKWGKCSLSFMNDVELIVF